MGWLKNIVKAAGIGVAATVAAPFVAAATGITAVTATVGIGLAGAATVFGGTDEDDIRKEGYEQGVAHGLRQGSAATAKKFANIWELSDEVKAAALATTFYVAKVDGAINEDEIACIEGQLAAADSNYHNDNLKVKFANVVNEINNGLSFSSIKTTYLSKLDITELIKLNNFVLTVIEADGGVTQNELDFLNNEWKPYLDSRGLMFRSNANTSAGKQNSTQYTLSKDESCFIKPSSAQQDFMKYEAEGFDYQRLWTHITHGDYEAIYKMGLAYDFGGFKNGINKIEACKWYKKAASHGHEAAKLRLNELLNQKSNAHDDYNKLLGDGISYNYDYLISNMYGPNSKEAYYKLGLAYDFGGLGVDVDKHHALEFYEHAACDGCEAAQKRALELLRENDELLKK